MSAEIVEDAEYEVPGQELARIETHTSPTLFGTADPAQVIVKAAEAAKPLAEAVRKQKLVSSIQGREHVRVEGWTLLGAMLGVFPVCVWSRKLENGWEARVEARTRDGAIVGAAEAECLRSEKTWANRDDYALRSMAQTRATSKALRQPLGFVMQLAGFDPTPAEEMPAAGPRADRESAPAQRESSQEEAVASPAAERDTPSEYALVKVHFGKNAGTPLVDLTPRQREWYAGDGWAKTKDGRDVSDADRRLRIAARVMCGLPPAEASGPFDDHVPF